MSTLELKTLGLQELSIEDQLEFQGQGLADWCGTCNPRPLPPKPGGGIPTFI